MFAFGLVISEGEQPFHSIKKTEDSFVELTSLGLQREQAWATFHSGNLKALLTSPHSLAIYRLHIADLIFESKLCQVDWTRVARAIGQLILQKLLSSHMGNNSLRCRVLDSNANSQTMAEGAS